MYTDTLSNRQINTQYGEEMYTANKDDKLQLVSIPKYSSYRPTKRLSESLSKLVTPVLSCPILQEDGSSPDKPCLALLPRI